MGIDIDYECTKATVLEELGQDQHGNRVVYCDLEFENEHGIALAPTKAVVVLRKNHKGETEANVENYSENLVDENLPDDEYEQESERLQRYCDESPGYDIYNGEETAELLGC